MKKQHLEPYLVSILSKISPVHYLNNKFTGTLAISYNEEYKFDKDDWIYIRQKSGVIGTLLDNYLNTPK